MSSAQGMITQLGIDSVSPVTLRFDFASASFGLREEFFDGNGLRGTLSHDISRVRQSIRRVNGNIMLQPNSAEMRRILPWIMGAAETGVGPFTYALGDATPLTRYVAVDRNASNLATYDTVAVNRAVFSASQGNPLSVELDLIGKDEAISGSFPAIAIDTATGPWMFHDLAVSVNAVVSTPKEFTLTIDNFIDADRFFNSATLSTPVKQDRSISFATRLPYGDFTALYNTGAGGVAVVATFTNGVHVLTFSLVKVAFPREAQPIEGRVEVMMPLNGIAYQSGGTKELVTTLAVS